MNKYTIAALACCTFVANAAQAVDLGNDPSQSDISNVEAQVGANVPEFGQLDVDNSGYLNKDEAMARPGLSENWKKFDNNEDGQLNRAEFSKFEEEDLEDRAKRMERAADKAEDNIDRAN